MEAEVTQSCKVEGDRVEQCIAASEEIHVFDDKVTGLGLIQIDSSSGSESDSDGSSDSDDSSSEIFSHAIPAPAYVERVPEEWTFYVHKKSKLLHKAKSGQSLTSCKTRLTGNFQETDRVIYFKYPKCMRCFVKDNNRVKSSEEAVAMLDEMSRKRKKCGPVNSRCRVESKIATWQFREMHRVSLS